MDVLDAVDLSLDNLENALAPLLEQPFHETEVKLDLLQKAKLQVLLPYVVNALVFIYLKTRGINPRTHPVVGELDRVKQYFAKIKDAEDPEKRRFVVDQRAATRFIQHAIKESQAAQERAQRELKQSTHQRFTVDAPANTGASAAALAKIQAREGIGLKEESTSDESDLEVFGENEGHKKRKHKEREDVTEKPVTGRKRRKGIDPWAGYDENENKSPTSLAAAISTEQAGRSNNGNGSPAHARERAGVDDEKSTADMSTARKRHEKHSSEESSAAAQPSGNQPSQDVDLSAEFSLSTLPKQAKPKKRKKK